MTRRINLAPFPDGWYCVADASDVPAGEIVPLHCFGRELICWRGTDGGPAHVQEAYCAHLGANIGCGGHVDGDTVVCPFHHWRYDGDGRNVEIPYRDKPQRAARLGTLPVHEANGHVYAWHSDTGSVPDWTPPRLPEASDERYMRVVSDTWVIRSHVQEIFENTVDIAHFQFVHGVSSFGAVELVEEGPMFRAVASVTMKTPRGDVEGAVESELWGLGIDSVRQVGLGPGRTLFTILPIDDTLLHARYTFFVERDPDSGEPSRYGRGLMREFERQITQDIPIWEHKIYRATPRLAMGEGPIVDFRRWTEQFYVPDGARA
jgi:phenylpropionate dioxygenase-like ring-hydroxylating dioxygenase large terminal subunit